MLVLKVKVISLPYFFQVLYVLCYTWPRYQVSVNRTIGPLVINNASLWKTLQATLLFYLMYVCVSIYRNDSLLMIIYKYEKID